MAKVRGLLKGWTGRRDGRESNHPIAFVLSGGGNLGALQIGTNVVLEQGTHHPDLERPEVAAA